MYAHNKFNFLSLSMENMTNSKIFMSNTEKEFVIGIVYAFALSHAY